MKKADLEMRRQHLNSVASDSENDFDAIVFSTRDPNDTAKITVLPLEKLIEYSDEAFESITGRPQPFKVHSQESLESLSKSIRENGVINPIIVRPLGDGTYQILAGRNRTRASRLCGNKDIPAIIRPDIDDIGAAMIMLDTNLEQRPHLCYSEKAYAYKMRVESEFIFDQYRSRIIRNSQVIPYGIDEFWYQNMGPMKKLNATKPIKLLTVGDISSNKNQKFVLRICNEMIKKGYKVEYNVVGRVKDKKIFNKLCREKYVNYLGWNEKEALLNIYRNNDIFILLSKTETFGLVYAEALTQCLPILYTRGEGFDSQVREGVVGYPITAGDLDEAISRLEMVLKSYEKLSDNTVEVVEKFKWNNIETYYSEIYLRSLR